MLTPVDVQNRTFKGGIGYDKKDVEAFLMELYADYERLYRSNIELNDKINALDESLQHYRSIEDSLQKALTLSEKTAEETVSAATERARQITTEAEKRAEAIVEDAKEELNETKNEIFQLKQQFSIFKKQFKKILQSMIKTIDGEVIDIDLGDFVGQFFGYGGSSSLGSGGLGGLGGGYVGSNEGFERTNQDSVYSRSSLNMDPFADAMNGGGRFSKHSNATNKRKTTNSNNSIAMPSKNKKSTVKKAVQPKEAPLFNEEEVAKPNPVAGKQVVSGDVEQKAKEQNRIDSEDNYAEGFEFESTQTVTSSQPSEEQPIVGEVERQVAESSRIDSEDNYAEGFDFSTEEGSESFEEQHDTYSGDVEDKYSEANMLDSEDNYADGFQFEETGADSSFDDASDNEPFVGEVESKYAESTMLDSEDNYQDGFDFIAGQESEEEEIPTIFSDAFETEFTSVESKTQSGSGISVEDVLSGDVEDPHSMPTMIGNDDEADDGFKFM